MRPHGFSLIELVIVVVIVGVIAAIAIPRLSRGTDGAKGPPANGVGPYGWVYNQAAGTIVANTASSKMDANDLPFNEY